MGSAEAAEAGPADEGATLLSLSGVEHDWMQEGLCTRRPDIDFFPGKGRRAAAAKVVCQQCSVQLPCLDYAIANEIVDGVWGGLSPQERSTIILRRRRARAAGE